MKHIIGRMMVIATVTPVGRKGNGKSDCDETEEKGPEKNRARRIG